MIKIIDRDGAFWVVEVAAGAKYYGPDAISEHVNISDAIETYGDGVLVVGEYDDGSPEYASVSFMKRAQIAAKASIVKFADAMADKITGPVPSAVKYRWPAKEDAARAHVAGAATADQTARLATEASLRSATVDDLAALIIGKADVYNAAVDQIEALSKSTVEAIDLATTQVEIDAIMGAAKSKAQAKLTAILSA